MNLRRQRIIQIIKEAVEEALTISGEKAVEMGPDALAKMADKTDVIVEKKDDDDYDFVGTVAFKSNDPKSFTTYRLALDKEGQYEPKPVVYVQRNLKGLGFWDGVPSGWYLDDVQGKPKLTIDGGQNWIVDVPKEAWDELSQFVETPS